MTLLAICHSVSESSNRRELHTFSSPPRVIREVTSSTSPASPRLDPEPQSHPHTDCQSSVPNSQSHFVSRVFLSAHHTLPRPADQSVWLQDPVCEPFYPILLLCPVRLGSFLPTRQSLAPQGCSSAQSGFPQAHTQQTSP